MNITIKYEIDNTSITDFAALEEEMWPGCDAAGAGTPRPNIDGNKGYGAVPE